MCLRSSVALSPGGQAVTGLRLRRLQNLLPWQHGVQACPALERSLKLRTSLGEQVCVGGGRWPQLGLPSDPHLPELGPGCPGLITLAKPGSWRVSCFCTHASCPPLGQAARGGGQGLSLVLGHPGGGRFSRPSVQELWAPV